MKLSLPEVILLILKYQQQYSPVVSRSFLIYLLYVLNLKLNLGLEFDWTPIGPYLKKIKNVLRYLRNKKYIDHIRWKPNEYFRRIVWHFYSLLDGAKERLNKLEQRPEAKEIKLVIDTINKYTKGNKRIFYRFFWYLITNKLPNRYYCRRIKDLVNELKLTPLGLDIDKYEV